MIPNAKQWNATPEQWQNAQWQLQHLITTPEKLFEVLGTDSFPGLATCHKTYSLRVTPYYLSLAKSTSPSDPILRQCLPSADELIDSGNGEDDPLDEERCSPIPRLCHRYPDRVLYITGNLCATHCRHCMRKRYWNQTLPPPDEAELETAVKYLCKHTEVREVLISGGDPLMFSDKKIKQILTAFSTVPNIEMLRIGSRLPVVLPMRFTKDFCKILGSCGKPVWFATHFNHPNELTENTAKCIHNLLTAGIPVVNQSVLLKGINDNAETLRLLFTGLLKNKIKPYYLFHGDPVLGTTHFRTGVKKGIELMDTLRGRISGLALPAFAFDLPHGAGKVRVEPDINLGKDKNGATIYRSYEGKAVAYPDW